MYNKKNLHKRTKEVLYNIRKIREGKNFSQKAVATELDLGAKAYSNIETGESALTVDKMFKIADVLHEDIEKIIPPSNNFTFNNCTQSGYFYQSDVKNLSDVEQLKWCIEQIQQLQKVIKEKR